MYLSAEKSPQVAELHPVVARRAKWFIVAMKAKYFVWLSINIAAVQNMSHRYTGAFGTETSSYFEYLQVVLWTGLRWPYQIFILYLGRRWENENVQASARLRRGFAPRLSRL